MVDDLDISRKLTDNAVIIPQDVESVQSAVEGVSLLYPLLTAPLAGKGQADLVCPGEHVKAARDFLKDCKKFLIIGSSGLDDDLLGVLDDAVDPGLNPKIHMMVVGSGQPTDETLRNFQDGVRAFRSLHRYRDDIPYTNGFREYVSSEEFKTFAEYKPP